MLLKTSFTNLFILFFFLTIKGNTPLFANTNQNATSFIGLWQHNNGKDSLRIEENEKDFLIIWKSKADNYKPHYINCTLMNNELIGDYYGHKNNLKIKLKEGNLYFTINPFAEFAPIVNQKYGFVSNNSIYVLPNETELFSLRTFNEKRMSICVDSNNQYLIYRFGTENNIELEYPKDKFKSFDLFKYDYYLRGGGIQNEGTDENRLWFINGNFQYMIYDDYYARGESTYYSIEIKNLQNLQEFVVKIEPTSVKGSLIHLRAFEKLQENELKSKYNLTEENLSSYLLENTFIKDKLHFGMKKSDVIAYLGKPDENWDDGRNEDLGEHFYYLKYNFLNATINLNDRKFQSEGEDFRICNIIIYGNSSLKTEKEIGIGSSVQEVMKAYKNEIEIGKAMYAKNTFGNQNQKHIHLGDIEGLRFTFENDKVVTINLGIFQWN
jgi:hypothetical protein